MGQIIKHIFYVNEGFSQNIPHHEYDNLQSAIDHIGADEKILIRVSSDLDKISELSFTNPRTDITIDAYEHFKISFDDRICRIRDDHNLKFMNVAELEADDIVMSGDNVNFSLKDIERTNIGISVRGNSNTSLNIDNINFYNVASSVIDIRNRFTKIDITRSYLKGGTHEPAIWYRSPNNQMVIKNSTLIHGDGIGLPIQVSGTFIPELKLYGCSGASRLTDGTVTNWIVDNHTIENTFIGE